MFVVRLSRGQVLENVVNFATLFILIGRSIRHQIGQWVLLTRTHTQTWGRRFQNCKLHNVDVMNADFRVVTSICTLHFLLFAFGCLLFGSRVPRRAEELFASSTAMCDTNEHRSLKMFKQILHCFFFVRLCSRSVNFSAKLFTLFVAFLHFSFYRAASTATPNACRCRCVWQETPIIIREIW